MHSGIETKLIVPGIENKVVQAYYGTPGNIPPGAWSPEAVTRRIKQMELHELRRRLYKLSPEGRAKAARERREREDRARCYRVDAALKRHASSR